MKLIEVTPLDNHCLLLRTEDGRSGQFDVKPYLEYEAFQSLKSQSVFEQVYNGGYFIEWPCGADLSADTLLARWVPEPNVLESATTPETSSRAHL
ncbi:DUF2442 domain-containing protein [Marinospirillum alkaliphilum]|uniref:DUF2442 domain-containing protein n=1 Tax=Marinospirillum alkaliphilum DSM 21637 TaxID=1122209 RepID=A0A1K1TVY5_9GAMM|nr:DUF2442 domain-containing protein [Marinospirillum alkaliphilum]SFX04500.1 Protein of unknown function [Marinospirillum alkaliphilum DSM 21637]